VLKRLAVKQMALVQLAQTGRINRSQIIRRTGYERYFVNKWVSARNDEILKDHMPDVNDRINRPRHDYELIKQKLLILLNKRKARKHDKSAGCTLLAKELKQI